MPRLEGDETETLLKRNEPMVSKHQVITFLFLLILCLYRPLTKSFH